MRRILPIIGSVVLSWMIVAPAQAGKCEASKMDCAGKKANGLLKCHAKAEKKGIVVDPLCTSKVEDKFDDPAKGCVAKAEAKGGCSVMGLTAVLETAIDTFVDEDLVPALDPLYPDPIPGGNRCSSKKKICAAKKARGLLKCHAKAERKDLAVDAACLQKAMDKFDGGSDPGKGCFAKLEAGDECLTEGDSAAIETLVDGFVEDIVCQIEPSSCPTTTTTTTTTTTITTTTTLPPPGCCEGGPVLCLGPVATESECVDDLMGTFFPGVSQCGADGCGSNLPAPCCEIGLQCAISPGSVEADCQNIGGVFTPSAICVFGVGCVAP